MLEMNTRIISGGLSVLPKAKGGRGGLRSAESHPAVRQVAWICSEGVGSGRRTFNLVVGPLLAAADVDEIEQRLVQAKGTGENMQLLGRFDDAYRG